ncbi:hypothetical protein ACS0VI_09995 [Streptomyces sp. H28]|uniref:hypothetical protein n=1 Tax=Streptomyces sp. H28 TaxID=2775865 RepID=UPI00177FA022|nr:hypothetical protein [Streptomyces sp. H28]
MSELSGEPRRPLLGIDENAHHFTTDGEVDGRLRIVALQGHAQQRRSLRAQISVVMGPHSGDPDADTAQAAERCRHVRRSAAHLCQEIIERRQRPRLL